MSRSPWVLFRGLAPALAIVVVPHGRALAQSPVAIEARAGGPVLVNGLSARVVALVRDLTDTRAGAARVVTVDNGAVLALGGSPRGLAIDEFEVIAPTVSLRAGWTPPCVKYNAAAVEGAIRTLTAELEALPLEKRREGLEALQIAASLSQLKQEQTRDSLRLLYNDPVTQFYRREYLENATVAQLFRDENQRAGEAFTQFTDAMGRSMTLYAEEAKTKYKVLGKDAARYKELVESSEKTLGMLRDRVAAVQSDLARRTEYQRAAVSEIERVATAADNQSVTADGVRRSCAGAANVTDVLEFPAKGVDGQSVLVGEMRFDAGESQTILVRRERGTDRWIGRFSWPVEASEARLRVRAANGGRWTTVPGSVRTGRASLTSLVATIADQSTQARKKYEDAERRAKGSDHVKSIIVPQ